MVLAGTWLFIGGCQRVPIGMKGGDHSDLKGMSIQGKVCTWLGLVVSTQRMPVVPWQSIPRVFMTLV